MSDKSLFPDGVPVTGKDLQFESGFRIKDIQRVNRDVFQVGVLEGFSVTVLTSDRSKVVVEPGSGYVGDVDYGSKIDSVFGSFIERSIQTILNAPSGGWYSSKTYYVNAVFKESITVKRPDEDGTALFNVRSENTGIDCDLEVMEKSVYLALSDAEKHKRLKLARIKPSGTTLADADVELPWTVSRVKTSTQPVNIAGVTITGVSSPCASGDASLEYDASPTKRLRWKDAGDSSFGDWVETLADGVYTLASDNTAKFITVRVSLVSLPSTDQTDTLEISDLYEGILRPASGADRLFRSFGGSGLKTRENPLGLTLGDLGESEEGISGHRIYMHSNGIVGSAGALASVVTHSGSNDYLSVTPPTGSDRYFVRGKDFDAIVSSERPVGTGLVNTLKFDDFNSDPMSLFQIYIDEYGTLKRSQRIKIAAGLAPNITGVVVLDVRLFNDTVSVTKSLAYTNASKQLAFDSGKSIYLAPNYDGVYTLYGQNGYDRVTIYVDYSELPTSDKSDGWEVVHTDLDKALNLLLCQIVYYAGNLFGIGADWSGGNPGGGTVLDQRSFGATGYQNLSLDTRQEMEYVGREILNNGVLSGLVVSGVAGSTLTVAKGIGYIKGQEVQLSADDTTDVSAFADGSYYVFLDSLASVVTLLEPVSDISEVLAGLMKEMLLLAKAEISSSSIDEIEDKRAKPGLGKLRDSQVDYGLISKVERGLNILASPKYASTRLYSIGQETYLARNLIYDFLNNQWMLEDPDNDGIAFCIDNNLANKIEIRGMTAGTGPGALASLGGWVVQDMIANNAVNWSRLERSFNESAQFAQGASQIEWSSTVGSRGFYPQAKKVAGSGTVTNLSLIGALSYDGIGGSYETLIYIAFTGSGKAQVRQYYVAASRDEPAMWILRNKVSKDIVSMHFDPENLGDKYSFVDQRVNPDPDLEVVVFEIKRSQALKEYMFSLLDDPGPCMTISDLLDSENLVLGDEVSPLLSQEEAPRLYLDDVTVLDFDFTAP